MSPVNASNILLHELIGLDIRVVNDCNSSTNGLSGRVIDETRKTLVLRGDGKPARIMKKNAVFTFNLPEGRVEVKGVALVGRPEDSVKRRFKRSW